MRWRQMSVAYNALQILRFGFKYPLPAFTFNEELFYKLTRAKRREQQIQQSKNPDVIFLKDNRFPTGLRGWYSFLKRIITIDCNTIMLECIILRQPNENIVEVFRKQIISTLAHEAGHWSLYERHGKISTLDKRIVGIITMVSAFVSFFAIMIFLSLDTVPYILMTFAGSFLIMPLALCLIVVDFLVIIAISIIGSLCIIGIGINIMSLISWHELFAQRFAKEATQNPLWQNVITIDTPTCNAIQQNPTTQL